MDYNEKWNDVCFDLAQCHQNNLSEKDYQLKVEIVLRVLGWSKSSNIRQQVKIEIGSAGHIIPDFVIQDKNQEQLFVIELKKPAHMQNGRDITQLFSYMKQLKLQLGLYIGDSIQLYYDVPNDRKDPILVLSIPFKPDDERGIQFVELFHKDSFHINILQSFCQEKLKAIQEKADLDALIQQLCSDEGKVKVKELLKNSLLSEKYSESLVEKLFDEISVFIKSNRPNEVHNEHTETISSSFSKNNESKRHHAKYRINNGVPLNQRKLAFAIISDYIHTHPSLTFDEIREIFPTNSIIRENNVRDTTRWFDEPMKSTDNITFFISNQWGIGYPNTDTRWILNFAKKAGYSVVEL